MRSKSFCKCETHSNNRQLNLKESSIGWGGPCDFNIYWVRTRCYRYHKVKITNYAKYLGLNRVNTGQIIQEATRNQDLASNRRDES